MNQEAHNRITLLLEQWRAGDRDAVTELWPLVAHQLQVMARKQLRGERKDHSFSTMDLVNEVYCKLFGNKPGNWENRAHFFAVAGKAMRYILITHANRRNTQKRGGGEIDWISVDLHELGHQPERRLEDLDHAIAHLEGTNAEAALIIELFYFCGCHIDEITKIMGLSAPTVKRRLQFARAWLGDYLSRK